MVSLSLDVALTVLTIATMMVAVQLVIVTVEIGKLRRDLLTLMRTTSQLNHAVNPWADSEEITSPDFMHPPRLSRRRRVSTWFRSLVPERVKRIKRRDLS